MGTFFACALAMSLGASGYIFRNVLVGWSHDQFRVDERKSIRVVVPRGMTADEVARLLADKGVIGDATLFYRYIRYVAKQQDALKAGEYDLSPDLTPDEILDILVKGRDAEVRVTIPEGSTKRDIARILAAAGFGSAADVERAMDDARLLESFAAPNGVPGGIEGYLFPDTYAFAPGTPPSRILKRMRARLDEVMDGELEARRRATKMTLHELLTMASIIEKETGREDERQRIASVFVNRVKKGMKLQTDPTVIYGLVDFDGDLKRSHLADPHLYNTYVHQGLPPGPICSPGKAALMAVLWPAATDDLFFVARGDGTGAHEFCATYECHLAATERLQR
jgi:UPF0755 protein